MDTSKEYIKMCKGAKEIQKQWQHRKLCSTGGIKSEYNNGLTIWAFWQECFYYINDIWLPRQDQLQEMIRDKNTFGGLICGFFDWLFEYGEEAHTDIPVLKDNLIKKFTSMEQLWLAFVMKEKYNKQWKDNKWINA